MTTTIQKSQRLARWLRHRPDAIGLALDRHGWADVADLLTKAAAASMPITAAELAQLVADNDKQRFAFNDDQTLIGLTLDRQGWADVNELLAKAAIAGIPITNDELQQLVIENDKQRFSSSDDGVRIRAKLTTMHRQGRLEKAWGDLDETDHWQNKYFEGTQLASKDAFFFIQ